MVNRVRGSLPWLGAVASGVLLGVAQPKLDLWPLAWVAWAPLLIAVRGQAPRDVARLAFAAHFIAFAIMLYWIEVVVRTFGGLPFPVTAIPLVLLAAYCALFYALAFWGARKVELSRPGLSMLWLLPFFVTAFEWVRGKLFTGFPWGHPGYSQYDVKYAVQVADAVGIDGILFWLMFVSVGAVAAVDLARRRKGALALVAAAVLVSAAGVGYSAWRLGDVNARLAAEAPVVKLGLAQGNIDQSLKWDEAFRVETLAIYETLTKAADGQGADLVLWPETAAPFLFDPQYDETDSKRVVALAKGMRGYLFFGAPAIGRREGRLRSFNRAYLLNRNGEPMSIYDKSHLVPFSEYIPLPMLFGWVEKLVPIVGNFAMGERRRALAIPGVKFGPLICYESIFPDEAREFVADGAQVLAIITNDAWFLKTSATFQHISMAVLRAVENRTPVVQAGNTGVTAIIAPNGTVQSSLPIFTRGVLVDSVKLVTIDSLFTRFGEWFAYLALLVTAITAVYALQVRPGRPAGEK